MKKISIVALLLTTCLLWGQEYSLYSCDTSIDDNVPEFFKKYFRCVDISMSESGEYVNLYYNGLPPYDSWYYSPQDANYIPWVDQGSGCSDGSPCNNGTCVGNGEHCYFQIPGSYIEEQNYVISIPVDPVPRDGLVIDGDQVDGVEAPPGVTYEYPMGSSGAALNGVSMFNPCAAGDDLIEDEAYSFDLYNAHPGFGGEYHYHTVSPGPLEVLEYQLPGENTGIELYGIMCDGTVVMGCMELDGSEVDFSLLDAQNGHVDNLVDEFGETLFENRYHTHMCYDELSEDIGPNGFEYHEFTPEISYYQTPGMGQTFDRCAAMSNPFEDDMVDLDGCTGTLACNYNPEATMYDGSCVYSEVDCSGECGGLDISCYTQPSNIPGLYDIYEHFYDNNSCEGEWFPGYECSSDCDRYYDSMDECIDNCSGGDCEAPYPFFSWLMSAVQMNEDGSVQSLMKAVGCDDGELPEIECESDADCVILGPHDIEIDGFCGNTGFCYLSLEDFTDLTSEEDFFINYHNWGVNDENDQLCFSRNTFYECQSDSDDFFSLDECEASCNESCEEDAGYIKCYDYSIDDDTGVITTIFPGYGDCLENVYTPIEISGCTDSAACNYNEIATEDNGSCFSDDLGIGCECYNDFGDNICDEEGCMDLEACNYDEGASIPDNDSCLYLDCGGMCGGDAYIDECDQCMCGDMYGPDSSECDDDDECEQGCDNQWYSDIDEMPIEDCSGVCDGDDYSCLGCMDEDACNYNWQATEDDDSCYWGDTDCSGECGGLDMSCYIQSSNIPGQYDIYEYLYDNDSCEGELPLEYQCSINNDGISCEDYGSLDECISNCSDGDCEVSYPHFSPHMVAVQLNEDGSAQPLMKLSNEICESGDDSSDGLEFECENDIDCDFSVKFGVTGFCGDTGYCYVYLEDTKQSDLYYNYHNWGVDDENNRLCFSRNTFYECESDDEEFFPLFFSLDECEALCNESIECEEYRGEIGCYDYSFDDNTDAITIILPVDTECLMNVYTPIDSGIDYSNDDITISSSHTISSIYPNPFNPVTNIEYSVSEMSDITLVVYDIMGHKIATLLEGVQNPGVYNFSWNAENLPTGIYFLSMKSGSFIQTEKLMLLK